jgi:hypothetical protein
LTDNNGKNPLSDRLSHTEMEMIGAARAGANERRRESRRDGKNSAVLMRFLQGPT